MSQVMLLSVAVFVFTMMVIGLGLTVLEFRYGQPKREDREARARDDSPESASTADAARSQAR